MTIPVVFGKSRTDARVSQEYMANELGVARRTIQNWEAGVSSPSLDHAFQWFQVLGVSPIPYLLEYVHPQMERIDAKKDDLEIRKALQTVINDLPPEAVRQLLFLFYGDHGSSPRGVMQLVTAHLQTPMKDRLLTAEIITHNYELASKTGKLSSPDHIQPDLAFLKEAIHQGERAVLLNRESYVAGGKAMSTYADPQPSPQPE